MFFMFLLVVVAVWLLWNISRNTADALDKQTALQYEIVALEKRLDELLTRMGDKTAARDPAPPMAPAPAKELAAPVVQTETSKPVKANKASKSASTSGKKSSAGQTPSATAEVKGKDSGPAPGTS